MTDEAGVTKVLPDRCGRTYAFAAALTRVALDKKASDAVLRAARG